VGPNASAPTRYREVVLTSSKWSSDSKAGKWHICQRLTPPTDITLAV